MTIEDAYRAGMRRGSRRVYNSVRAAHRTTRRLLAMAGPSTPAPEQPDPEAPTEDTERSRARHIIQVEYFRKRMQYRSRDIRAANAIIAEHTRLGLAHMRVADPDEVAVVTFQQAIDDAKLELTRLQGIGAADSVSRRVARRCLSDLGENISAIALLLEID
jgi:hypothetical protein